MKKLFLLFISITTFISCTHDPDLSTDHSSFLWYTSSGFEEADYTLGIEDYITLLDLSKNPSTNLFTIPETAKFIKGDLNRAIEDFTPYIIPNTGNTISDTKVNVIFSQAGLQTIILKNTYEEELEGTTLIEDQWVAEQTFTIDVFDRIKPALKLSTYDVTDPENPVLEDVFSLNEDEEPTIESKADWQVITIEAGEEVVFTDITTTGRSTARTWYTDGGKPEESTKEIANIRYNKPGEYTAYMESKRSGSDVPTYTAEKLIPVLIKVIPSSKPFVIDGNVTLNNGIISFSVTGEIESVIAQASKFTVHVTNTAASFDVNIPVSSVSINSDDSSVVDLELAETIYNTDTIEISFTDGNVTSVDGRVLENFGPLEVKQDTGASIFVQDIAGFENENANWKKGFCKNYFIGNGNGTEIAPIFSRTLEKAYEGEASMRFKVDELSNISLLGLDLTKPNGLNAGTYLMTYMVFIKDADTDDSNNINVIKTQLKSGSTLLQNKDWSLEGVEKNKWVKIEQSITVDDIASGTKIDLRFETIDNPNATGPQTIYFDSFSWVRLNPRP
ncbi:putative RNA-binding protein with TRAM domain [Wenyingzhuangia heitensis]|uniref:RNA-binding protein with TRAM domain n=1 Tax=Wenyingzhuangia heitensis TaxID=1487859 RepID=A0ABX0U5Z9_9FLAO|nr:hypothetical protein [Wenyingzhuangia heitensis]NIJ44272.1 putative RNA-binding protein with TRAM domain [Wenyingzhuangia heitensis]